MDKIKETREDSPQSLGKAPEGSEETTPKADAKTYTEKDMEKALQADRIKRGRDDKSLSNRETAIKTREDAIAESERQREAAELEEAKNDPDKLAVYQSRQAERQRTKKQDERDADQDKREAEHEAEITAAKEAQKEITIWQVASAKNIDLVRLKDLSEKFNVEGKEKLEELADEIASGNSETSEKKKTVDSLVTSGGKASSEGKTSRQIYADNFRDKDKK